MSRATRVRRILLAQRGLSHDERFPAQVLWFAKEQSAHLHLVHVASPLTAAADRERALERLANKARERGLQVSTRVCLGTPHAELIREVVAVQADMLVVLERERTGRLGFGSITRELLRTCPCPVWAIRSPMKRSGRRIMAAVELGPAGSAVSRLNRRSLRMSSLFARGEGDTLYVFHPWSDSRGREQTPAPDDARRAERRYWNTRTNRKRRLQSLARQPSLAGIDVETRLEEGAPEALVPEVTRQLGIDLLVIGALWQRDEPRTLFGNTAEQVLENLGCSVVAIKPEGASRLD